MARRFRAVALSLDGASNASLRIIFDHFDLFLFPLSPFLSGFLCGHPHPLNSIRYYQKQHVAGFASQHSIHLQVEDAEGEEPRVTIPESSKIKCSAPNSPGKKKESMCYCVREFKKSMEPVTGISERNQHTLPS
jgi:hypothetical protein